jgi:hypothetical protein
MSVERGVDFRRLLGEIRRCRFLRNILAIEDHGLGLEFADYKLHD